jgi:hypothetical protein
MKVWLLILTAMGCAAAQAGTVTERWGEASGRHTGKVSVAAAEGGGVIVKYDLSDLPKGVKIFRARFLPHIRPTGAPLDEPLLVQALAAPTEAKTPPRLAGQPARLIGPRFVTLDVTEIVRQWASGQLANSGLLVRGAVIERPRTFLEISYEGTVKEPPPAATGLKAWYRAGQVFLTWQEVNTPFAGKEAVQWKDLKAEQDRIRDGKGPIVSYRIYRHTRPITAATLAEAELLDEAPQHSAFDEREIKTEWKGEQLKNVRIAEALVPRVFVEEQQELPIGTGVWVTTCRKDGRFYYAVVSAADGVENTAVLEAGNTAGPLAEKVAPTEPIYVRAQKFQYDKDRTQQCYLWWLDYPLNSLPTFMHISFAVPIQPTAEQPPLVVDNWWFSSGWNIALQGPCTGAVQFNMDHNLMDTRGWHEGCNTYKAASEGVVRCWFVHQLRALLPWIKAKYNIDEERIYAVSGGWAWHYGDLFALDLDGITMNLRVSPAGSIIPVRYWGHPSKPYATEWGISAWDWWDAGLWVQKHPTVELPFVTYSPHLHTGDFGRLDKPQFFRAMLDTKRAFSGVWHEGGHGHRNPNFLLELRRSDSLPAFGNCSLDDNPGIGLGGDEGGQINAWLAFEPRTQLDAPDRWEMTVYLIGGEKGANPSQSAPLDSCTADVTPRRCQKFKALPGEKFAWTNTSLAENKVLQTGTAVADQYGFVTAEKVTITKGKNRLVIKREQRS